MHSLSAGTKRLHSGKLALVRVGVTILLSRFRAEAPAACTPSQVRVDVDQLCELRVLSLQELSLEGRSCAIELRLHLLEQLCSDVRKLGVARSLICSKDECG